MGTGLSGKRPWWENGCNARALRCSPSKPRALARFKACLLKLALVEVPLGRLCGRSPRPSPAPTPQHTHTHTRARTHTHRHTHTHEHRPARRRSVPPTLPRARAYAWTPRAVQISARNELRSARGCRRAPACSFRTDRGRASPRRHAATPQWRSSYAPPRVHACPDARLCTPSQRDAQSGCRCGTLGTGVPGQVGRDGACRARQRRHDDVAPPPAALRLPRTLPPPAGPDPM